MAARNRTEPTAALSSTDALADALAGMAWWNALSRFDRAYWLGVADSAVPADAWRAYQQHVGHGRPAGAAQ